MVALRLATVQEVIHEKPVHHHQILEEHQNSIPKQFLISIKTIKL